VCDCGGGKIVDRDTFKNSDASLASQVTRLRTAMAAGKVDAIVFCSYLPGGSSAIRQIRAAGIDLPISPAARSMEHIGSAQFRI
jgi:branched-chain amino acid transport system substrate-binding protein